MAATLGDRRHPRNAAAALIAVAGGLAHGAAFPPLGLAPLALAPVAVLGIVVRRRSMAAGALFGWIAGTAASTIVVVPWLARTALDFFALGPAGALALAFAAAQLFGALPIAAFGALAARATRLESVPARMLLVGAAWVTTELARTHLLTGMPWALLGHALAGVPTAIQVADVGGAYAVSFAIAVVGQALAECVASRGRVIGAPLATAFVVTAATLGYGAWALAVPPPTTPPLSVALVQGNVPNEWRNDPRRVDAALDVYLDATADVLAGRPDLVVWPENAVSVVLDANARLRTRIATVLGPDAPPLLLGAPRVVAEGGGHVRVFNAAHLLRGGTIVASQDKRRLVPFAEYAPPGPVPALAWRADAAEGYAPGDGAVAFDVPPRVGVLVCYEAIFPELARDLVRAGSRVLVNVSNDAWFGTGGAREQHLAAVVFRSVETRRPLVRVANAGITAVVDAWGRVERRFPTGVRGAWQVNVTPGDATTLYVAWGDAFAWGAVAATIAMAVATRRR